jgi:peptidoglycan hydrolase-like protein with peptidoglycan-binding domain
VTPVWWTRDLTLGDEGDDVRIVQRKLDAAVTGTYDDDTAARVRGLEKKMGKKQTGVVDAGVAETLGEKATAGQVPEWFTEDCGPGCSGPCVARLRVLLKQPNLPVYYDNSLENAVRRFQSANGLDVTGVVDEATAVSLADRSF